MDKRDGVLNAGKFLKEIKNAKLTGREFLALIGNSKINNEIYNEIKQNPQLTYARLVELLESSELTSYDYERLLKAAYEKKQSREIRQKSEDEIKLVDSVNKNAEVVRKFDENETIQKYQKIINPGIIKPKFDDLPQIKPKPIKSDENESPLIFKPTTPSHQNQENSVPNPIITSHLKNNDFTRKINLADDTPVVKKVYEKINADDFDIDDDEDNDDNDDFKEYEDYDDYDDYGEDYETSDGHDASYRNRSAVIICFILAAILTATGFGLRFMYTGSFFPEQETEIIFKVPETYSELANILYPLSNIPAEESNNKNTENKNYYIDLKTDFYKKDKFCYNDRYAFNIIDNSVYVTEQIKGNIKKIAIIEKKGLIINEIFIHDDNLFVIYEGKYQSEYFSENDISVVNTDKENQKETVVPLTGSFEQVYTDVSVFNALSFNEKPLLAFTLDGKYSTTQIHNENVYILSDYQVKNAKAADDLKAYIPSFSFNGEENKFVDMESIHMPVSYFDSSNMKVFCEINKNLEAGVSAVLGGQTISTYAGDSSLFFIGQNKTEFKSNIIQINENLEAPNFTEVQGIVSAKSMNEKNGTIRICAELENRSAIYIYNEVLEPLSVVNNIAENEKQNSVLFDENCVYIITDLLYVFDTSVPDDPIIVTESDVKILSDDYYRWSDRERLSLSVAVDEQGKRSGIRLTMYKIEKGVLVEKSSTLVTALVTSIESFQGKNWNHYLRTPAESDYNSLYFNPDTGLILLPVIYFDGISEIERYVVIDYTETQGFDIRGGLIYYDHNNEQHRAFSYDSYIYTFWDTMVVSAKYADISIVEQIELSDITRKTNDILPVQNDEQIENEDFG